MLSLLKFWKFLVMPAKLYGGGGGSYVSPTYNPQQEALANIASQKYDQYRKTYLPFENSQMKQVSGLNSPQWHDLATGMTGAGVMQQAGPQTASNGQSMVGQRLMQNPYNSIASAKSASQSSANSGVTGRYLGAEQGIVNMGNGQSGQAIQGLSSVAQQAVSGNQANAENQLTNNLSNQQTLGTLAGGVGAGLYGLSTKQGA